MPRHPSQFSHHQEAPLAHNVLVYLLSSAPALEWVSARDSSPFCPPPRPRASGRDFSAIKKAPWLFRCLLHPIEPRSSFLRHIRLLLSTVYFLTSNDLHRDVAVVALL